MNSRSILEHLVLPESKEMLKEKSPTVISDELLKNKETNRKINQKPSYTMPPVIGVWA